MDKDTLLKALLEAVRFYLLEETCSDILFDKIKAELTENFEDSIDHFIISRD